MEVSSILPLDYQRDMFLSNLIKFLNLIKKNNLISALKYANILL